MPNKTNQGPKFVRAVKSFLNQTYQDKELIIVADGCAQTMSLYHENFTQYPNIKIIPIPKQAPYSGEMRNVALPLCSGEVITFLDADDCIKKTHLQYISDNFDINEQDFIYYNDLMVLNKEFTKFYTREVEPRWGSIGTSSISIKNPKLLKKENIKFGTGYGHDFLFVLLLNSLGLRFKKIEETSGYIVAHYRDGDF
jgi:cellulose synthase/poly-beta-1,6-N-acetylglucosamine synthase-like glycosyltransferase